MNDIHIHRDGRIEIREPREYESPLVSEAVAWPPHVAVGATFTSRYWRIVRRRDETHGIQILVER